VEVLYMRVSNRVITIFLAVLFSVMLVYPAFSEVLTLELPPFAINEEVDTDNVVSFSGMPFRVMSATGDPSLPWVSFKVLLPGNADPDTVSVTLADVEEEQVPGTCDVQPVMPVATWDGEKEIFDDPEEGNLVDGKNMNVYTRDEEFPSSRIHSFSTGEIRGEKVLDVTVAAYRYNPVQGILYKLNSADLVVYYETDPAVLSSSSTMDPVTESMLKDRVINFPDSSEETDVLSSSSSPQAGTGYAIITTSSIVKSSTKLSSFVEWKQSRGFTVYTITEDSWGGGTGNTAAENIRTWLKNNYSSISLKYVLFIGDPDPSDSQVPMKMLWPRNNATGEYTTTDFKQSPSDIYYADLSGNWDKDGDGYYGEYGDDFGSGGVDLNWELYVGRIPYYGNVSDLDSILLKIMNYENSSEDEIGWRENVLLPMKPSDTSTPGYHLGEAVKDDILPSTWGYTRVYDYDGSYVLSPAPEVKSCTKDNVTSSWNSGNYGGVFWWTHGSSTSATDIMDTTYAATLDDSHPSVVFQGSCFNAHPETSSNLSYSLLKNGAIATIGATRYSWYSPGQTSFAGSDSSAGMTYDFSVQIIEEGDDFGTALFMVKEGQPSHESWWMNFTDFNLYGDPSLDLGSSDTSSRFLVSGRVVTDDGALSGATVTLEGDFVEKETTTSSTGSYILEVPEGSYTLTVSKANYVFDPSSKSVSVEDSNLADQDFIAEPASSTTSTSTSVSSGGGGGGGCNTAAMPLSALLLLIPLLGIAGPLKVRK
jgi:hypothetical protein